MKHLKDKIKNFYVVDEITDLFDMTFVPYQHDPNNFPKKTNSICIAHQTFKGADYGAIVATDGVDAASIEGCEIIISGHIHKRSVTGIVNYVGSPFSQSASDVDQVKGITIFDSETLQADFFECPLPMWRRYEVQLTNQVSATDLLESLHVQLLKHSKDNWIIDLSGPKAEVTSLIASKDYKTTIKNFNVTVKASFTDSEKKKVAIKAKSIEEIISQYVAKVYDGTLDTEKLLSTVKEVMVEANIAK